MKLRVLSPETKLSNDKRTMDLSSSSRIADKAEDLSMSSKSTEKYPFKLKLKKQSLFMDRLQNESEQIVNSDNSNLHSTYNHHSWHQNLTSRNSNGHDDVNESSQSNSTHSSHIGATYSPPDNYYAHTDDNDSPIDMSLKPQDNPAQTRPSVITCASSFTPDTKPENNESGPSDSVIDEHFLRSLGKENFQRYMKPDNSRENVSTTVDDHFYKALGNTWVRLNESKSEESNDQSSSSPIGFVCLAEFYWCLKGISLSPPSYLEGLDEEEIIDRKDSIDLQIVKMLSSRLGVEIESLLEKLPTANTPTATHLKVNELDTLRKEDYKEAVHCMIHAKWNKQLVDGHPSIAAVMMQMRFDGSLGFPGGSADDNESVLAALRRELLEEVNLDTKESKDFDFVHISTFVDHMTQNLYHFYALELTYKEFQLMERKSHDADCYESEVMGNVRVPLYCMEDGKSGFPTFLRNEFVATARYQLILALKHLKILGEEELVSALKKSACI
ncbi:U8 snoRNA-decapping enzyme [Nymphon striatum]|nr:U8 snoRNA-decapping enzyme [Nymphon striatum]